MAILSFRVSNYALNINMTGQQRYTGRDNFTGIPAEYAPHVKAYAAKNYYVDDIDRAFANGWLTAEEHQDTLDLKTESDPQFRPSTLNE
ncbi:hypothetical protein [Paenibacillus rigui]|uniref:Uncharacterized protein n=1 Tax=Paenibacillus rigui TaxID=554312 RepID=A0A229UMC1_9BACL|nr:hypothetical protein [Paenibacillus rigui]OXM84617.1 hypothetical protein CF651_19110 [Paenibacillus rigui]